MRLEDRMLDVAEVLAVRLQRQRLVAANLDPVEVEPVITSRPVPAAHRDRRDEPKNVAAADALRRREGEADLEPRAAVDPQRHGPCVRVGIAVARRRRTPRGRRLRSRAAGRQLPRRSSSIRATIRPKARSPGRAPAGSRPSSSSRLTASASKPIPAEKLKRRPLTRAERDPARPALRERGADGARGVARVTREPERARQARSSPPPGRKPIGSAPSAPVQRFVVRAVAGEDDDRVDRVAPPPPRRARSRGPGAAVKLVSIVDAFTQRVLDRGDRRRRSRCVANGLTMRRPASLLRDEHLTHGPDRRNPGRRKPRSARRGSPTTARRRWAFRAARCVFPLQGVA